MYERPVTTLFMLMSLDGKISTGVGDVRDFDLDLPKIKGVREELHQYYEAEQETDLWSLNSGKTLAKIGINNEQNIKKTSVNFVVIDNENLTETGVKNLCDKSDKFVLFTTNHRHPAVNVEASNKTIFYHNDLDLDRMFEQLYNMGCENLTVQTGGTLNGLLLRNKLIDYVDIFIAPIIVGGRETPTLVDGQSIIKDSEISKLGVLELIEMKQLENSYIRLKYKTVSNVKDVKGYIIFDMEHYLNDKYKADNIEFSDVTIDKNAGDEVSLTSSDRYGNKVFVQLNKEYLEPDYIPYYVAGIHCEYQKILFYVKVNMEKDKSESEEKIMGLLPAMEYFERETRLSNALYFSILKYIRNVNNNINGFLGDNVFVYFDNENNQYIRVNIEKLKDREEG